MADYLRKNDLAALWYHPSDEVSTVLLAYGSSSTSWGFFDQGVDFPSSSGLRIVSRSYLAPISTVRQPLSIPEPLQTVDDPIIIDELVPSIPDEPPSSLPKDLSNLDIVTLFRERWRITFKELSIVNGPKKDSFARAFYLYFPSEAEDEFQLVLMFLRKYTNAIFSNRLKGDWERFAETVDSGTVLVSYIALHYKCLLMFWQFHQSYAFYEFMPGLHKLLRKHINIFNISLDRPVKHVDYEIHLQRLFPHGAVILITEDYIIHETESALNVIKWFRAYSEKRFPGTWKLFLRPNVLGWLSEIFDKWVDDKMYQIYCILEHMILNYAGDDSTPISFDGESDDEGQPQPLVSPSFIPDYGSRQEDEHEDIPKGLLQEERNTDHLVEYFAGWAICNCDRYRRFVTLSHYKPQPRWKKWQHIENMNTQEFLRIFVNNDLTRRSSKHHPSPSSAHRKLQPTPPRPPPA
ncbi:predicted protein [Uncinocarpus reesii 1704]|uniref:Uncharacterized protein n=1 Tax=Uncinocarpus reesii (strain UAMH 1704) TaxID=336963 RepID=C4JMQ8_UNCRE|nr:uncharacterized protein UREG_04116 [Uncinocarpus reesii 1704]EEP79270.1 predicted protein [Uncinocarpus reesii 1704]